MTNKETDFFTKNVLKSYFLLRVGMAGIGIIMPLILWFGGLLLKVDLQNAISLYYHTPMRNVLVGCLFAVGSFLYLYKGFDEKENMASNIAGFLAIGIAIFPTGIIKKAVDPSQIPKCPILSPECETFTAPLLHNICAISFFLMIAICISTGSNTIGGLREKSRQLFYKKIYIFLSICMIALPLLSVLLVRLLGENLPTFFVQLICIWCFSVYWIIKTLEIRESQMESRSNIT
jgi:hypothetical protein